ncbi:MAG: tRNA (adenosine(37)-N6)-threonylcarbamoyltransferase complex ATPase subunit type 1 TsaE [Robiginitomaculum sp.]|nr:MAG: tRNA (adenosine(37)-N6)-threonylcarbamoyltransferase complex ATPase subunit type 1 TsaE [Robiginitomaculum sp.]
MTTHLKTIKLRTLEENLSFGARLGVFLRQGDIVALRGGLGVGKTSFSRGLISQLCDVDEVPSPTYTLVQTYDAPNFSIWHFDLYRLENEADVWELGIEEALDDGVCLIEWPERIEGLLSGAELMLEFVFEEQGRTVHIHGDDNWRKRLVDFE